jgi:AraC-like DNA-binding protein
MAHMLCEHSTLANVPRLLADTLRSDYGIDPAPLLARVGIDAAAFLRPGARVPYRKMFNLWDVAVDETSDPLFGFRVGARAVPGDFYVFGHSWLVTATVLDALERFCRYIAVVSTAATDISLQQHEDTVVVVENFPDPSLVPHKAASDAGYVALNMLFETIARRPVHPVSVELVIEKDETSAEYEKIFRCPIVYGARSEKLSYARVDVEEQLPGSVPELLDASDALADRYLETLDTSTVSAEVRRQIIQMLPSGRADQTSVAEKLYRSRATLQRQLQAEGTSFRAIRDATRRNLAERYLRAGKLAQAEIAFLTGFTDQSNFARAFKRWAGVTPGEFQQEAERKSGSGA